jgi:anti-sigma factor RsiW
LNEYLDDTRDTEVREQVERHISECPNCWVVFDTTKKTLSVFKGMEPQELPEEIHTRLMQAIEKRLADKAAH